MERTTKAPRTVSYLRVSTDKQDTEKNREAVYAFASRKDFARPEFVEDVASGTIPWRQRKLGSLIDELSEGDRLILPEISRISRSSFDIFSFLQEALNRGIAVYSLKEGWELNGTIQSKVVAFAFGMAADIERELISQRTKEALAARKASGVKLGRPRGAGKSLLDAHRDTICERLRMGHTKTDIARDCGCTAGNLINWMKKNNIDPWKED